jgi:L-alanine-DL-glutamate epimerase-like enolase superfamily enzyme
MRLLREKLDLRIAGGELDREMAELRDLVAGGCLDVIQPDVVSVGGITGLAKVAAMAGEHGIAFTPHSWGNGIGVAANAHLMAGATRRDPPAGQHTHFSQGRAAGQHHVFGGDGSR